MSSMDYVYYRCRLCGKAVKAYYEDNTQWRDLSDHFIIEHLRDAIAIFRVIYETDEVESVFFAASEREGRREA